VTLSYAAAVSARPPQKSYGWIGVLVTVVLDIVFGVISWHAFAAMPKFRAQPAWCQELIASAGL
jgi:hypothetical protein